LGVSSILLGRPHEGGSGDAACSTSERCEKARKSLVKPELKREDNIKIVFYSNRI
jgi:hypothetical protein